MALTKDKKSQVVAEVTALLQDSKMTVVAGYQGTTVKAMQELRKTARENGTVVKIVKNRLVVKALEASKTHAQADTTKLNQMLLFAFNQEDEVAPAQVLATFAKTHPTITFVGAYTAEGSFIDATAVTALSTLPSKNQLLAGIVSILESPLRSTMSALEGNLHGLLQALESKATS